MGRSRCGNVKCGNVKCGNVRWYSELTYISSVCTVEGKQSDLIMCSVCKNIYHTYCMDPVLTSKPAGFWICPNHDMNSMQLPPGVSRMVRVLLLTYFPHYPLPTLSHYPHSRLPFSYFSYSSGFVPTMT